MQRAGENKQSHIVFKAHKRHDYLMLNVLMLPILFLLEIKTTPESLSVCKLPYSP